METQGRFVVRCHVLGTMPRVLHIKFHFNFSLAVRVTEEAQASSSEAEVSREKPTAKR